MRPENGIINKIKSPCGGNVRQRLVNRKKKKILPPEEAIKTYE